MYSLRVTACLTSLVLGGVPCGDLSDSAGILPVTTVQASVPHRAAVFEPEGAAADRAVYLFTGRPVIQPWGRIPRRV